MKLVLDSLVEVKRISEIECDDVLNQCEEFMDDYSGSAEFVNFDPNVNRLDVLFYERICKEKKFEKFWAICKISLLLSHGQASIESGFSVKL